MAWPNLVAYAMAGRKAEALKVLAHLEAPATQRYSSPVRNACIYSGLGGKERTFKWLEKGYAGRTVASPRRFYTLITGSAGALARIEREARKGLSLQG